MRLWFRFSLVMLVVTLVMVVVILRERAERKRLKNLEKLVTERTRELEQAMDKLERAKEAEVEAQRLKVVNQLAATIAHEFNNPLGIIQGFCDLTQIERSTDQKLRERMEKVGLQVARMHSLVRKLLRLRTLREMDYAAGLKILDIHTSGDALTEQEGEGSETVDLSQESTPTQT